MAQQTAVQWLWDKIGSEEFINNPNELLKEALRMESEQRKPTYNGAKNMDYLNPPPPPPPSRFLKEGKEPPNPKVK